MLQTLLNPLVILMSFSTATGVLVHDMHIDTAASTAFSLPSMMANYDSSSKLSHLGGDSHTHVERSAFAHLAHAMHGQDPRVAPRTSEDKKYLLQKHVVRGHHAFDNYNLPIV